MTKIPKETLLSLVKKVYDSFFGGNISGAKDLIFKIKEDFKENKFDQEDLVEKDAAGHTSLHIAGLIKKLFKNEDLFNFLIEKGAVLGDEDVLNQQVVQPSLSDKPRIILIVGSDVSEECLDIGTKPWVTLVKMDQMSNLDEYKRLTKEIRIKMKEAAAQNSKAPITLVFDFHGSVEGDNFLIDAGNSRLSFFDFLVDLNIKNFALAPLIIQVFACRAGALIAQTNKDHKPEHHQDQALNIRQLELEKLIPRGCFLVFNAGKDSTQSDVVNLNIAQLIAYPNQTLFADSIYKIASSSDTFKIIHQLYGIDVFKYSYLKTELIAGRIKQGKPLLPLFKKHIEDNIDRFAVFYLRATANLGRQELLQYKENAKKTIRKEDIVQTIKLNVFRLINKQNLEDLRYYVDVVIEQLKKEGISFDIDEPVLGTTILFYACEFFGDEKSRDIVKFILSKKPDANKQCEDGSLALYAACQKGDSRLVKLLLDAGANPNLTIENGLTSLHIACTNAKCDVLSILLEGKANIYARVDGQSSIHFACDGGQEAVKLILQKVSQHQQLEASNPNPELSKNLTLFAQDVGDILSIPNLNQDIKKLLEDFLQNSRPKNSWFITNPLNLSASRVVDGQDLVSKKSGQCVVL
ncbi:MAG: ankyrin repeat domain-containing protein [Pseudomonadota bacterium]